MMDIEIIKAYEGKWSARVFKKWNLVQVIGAC